MEEEIVELTITELRTDEEGNPSIRTVDSGPVSIDHLDCPTLDSILEYAKYLETDKISKQNSVVKAMTLVMMKTKYDITHGEQDWETLETEYNGTH